ncbi:MAG: STAS domain-containing protein [Bacteroidetes bacterium]|nr:STAS domain-containing protein [Bacteroidota bacterium]
MSVNVKIDTKEKFSVIRPESSKISAIMAEELENIFHDILKNTNQHVILNLENVAIIENVAASSIAKMQQLYYENKRSFVICCANEYLIDSFRGWDLISILNLTPTESEAWDMIHMEEIERELLDDEN